MRADAATHPIADHGTADGATDNDARARATIGGRCEEVHHEGRAATTTTPAHDITEFGAASDSGVGGQHARRRDSGQTAMS